MKGDHQESWAAAFGDTREWVVKAKDEEEREVALRWAMAIPSLLLRLPQRGGSGYSAIERRFEAWREGK